MNREELKQFYKTHNLSPSDVHKDKRGFIIISKDGIEKVQHKNNIKIAYEVIVCDLDNVVLKAVSMQYDPNANEFVPIIESFGSASKNNCNIHFLVEMAEKRAKARCIIQTMKWSGIKGQAELENQPSASLNALKK
tara:strand:- start:1034 stop:1441 length:408 start_codon:yes stop_codon:yes gene_type:complete